MKDFIKYPSLENHYNVHKSRKFDPYMDELFYATEKIHGSNMSIHFTKDTIRYFLRKEEVNIESGLGKYLYEAGNTPYIENIVKQMFKINEAIDKIIVYGELYGAGIQSMSYKENLENKKNFRVFDVFVFEQFRRYSLPLDDLSFLFGDVMAPRLKKIQTLKAWLTSELPTESFLGGDIEGLVYKPVNGQELILNSTMSIENYIGVKHKTLKFTETKQRQRTPKKALEFTVDQITFKDDIARYFTKARLDNVMSKEEFELSVKNLSKIIPLFLEDVEKDYKIDNGEDVYFDKKIFNKMSYLIVDLVKES